MLCLVFSCASEFFVVLGFCLVMFVALSIPRSRFFNSVMFVPLPGSSLGLLSPCMSLGFVEVSKVSFAFCVVAVVSYIQS